MANFLSDVLGNDGIAKMAGEKVGDFVESTVKNVLSGQGQKGEEKGGQEGSGDKGGFGIGDALSLVEGKKEDDKGGFGIGDALSLVEGNKDGEKEGEGLDVKKALGGLFG